MEALTQYSCEDFAAALASREAVPGGGGASALAAALGVALGNMVGSLTAGKKKYAAVEADIQALNARAETLRRRLLGLVQADAEAFAPLAQAYGLPRATPEEQARKAAVMEQALHAACRTPLEILRVTGQALELIEQYAAKGSALAISDAGVAAALCRGAMQGAALNVYINTRAMADRTHAAACERETDALLAQYIPLADRVYERVTARLRK